MSVRQWLGDDIGYENWLAANPTGFQANLRNPPGGRYFKIHRATCSLPDRSLPASVNPRTGNKYMKLTADSVAELVAWAGEHMRDLDDLDSDNYCKVCAPTGGGTGRVEPGAEPDRAP